MSEPALKKTKIASRFASIVIGLNEGLFDVTHFVGEHPGEGIAGQTLRSHAGRWVVEEWEKFHSGSDTSDEMLAQASLEAARGAPAAIVFCSTWRFGDSDGTPAGKLPSGLAFVLDHAAGGQARLAAPADAVSLARLELASAPAGSYLFVQGMRKTDAFPAAAWSSLEPEDVPDARETQPPPALVLVWTDGTAGVTCDDDGSSWRCVARRDDGSVDRDAADVDRASDRHASLDALARAVVGPTASAWSPATADDGDA